MSSDVDPGRLRIFSGLGSVRYDSAGEPDDERDELRQRLFKRGLLLYYHPGNRFVRCFFKAHNEQFLAEYRARSDDVIPEFERELRDAVAEMGWELSSPEPSDNAIIFHELGETTPEAPAQYDGRTLTYLLDQGERLDFAVPSKLDALRTFEYFRSEGPDLVLAIGQNGRVDAIDEEDEAPDVVLKPDGSVDRVVGIDGTEDAIQRGEHERRSAQLARGLDSIAADADGEQRAAVMATALQRAGIADYGFTATYDAAASARLKSVLLKAAVVGAPVGFVALLLEGLPGWYPSLSEDVATLFGGPTGIIPTGLAMPVWLTILAVFGILYAITLVFLAQWLGIKPLNRVVDLVETDADPDVSDEAVDNFEEIFDRIDRSELADPSEILGSLTEQLEGSPGGQSSTEQQQVEQALGGRSGSSESEKPTRSTLVVRRRLWDHLYRAAAAAVGLVGGALIGAGMAVNLGVVANATQASPNLIRIASMSVVVAVLIGTFVLWSLLPLLTGLKLVVRAQKWLRG